MLGLEPGIPSTDHAEIAGSSPAMTNGARTVATVPDNLYTIGYEGAAIEDFIAALRLAGVAMLIDVRDAPWSRNRVFTKGALRTAVEDAGIAYAHLKGLGTPKTGREAAKAGEAGSVSLSVGGSPGQRPASISASIRRRRSSTRPAWSASRASSDGYSA